MGVRLMTPAVKVKVGAGDHKRPLNQPAGLNRVPRPAIIALLVSLLLFGCSVSPEHPQPPIQKPTESVQKNEAPNQNARTSEDAAQAPMARFTLLAPAALGDTPLRLQRLTVSRPHQKRTLLAQWQVHSGRLSLEALTSLGLPLLSLTYSAHRELTTQAYIPIPEGLSAHRVIADLQWAYWPIAALRESLQAGYHIRDQQKTCTHGHQCRQLWYQQQLISEVDALDPAHNTLVIVDHQYRYQLHISTLTVTP